MLEIRQITKKKLSGEVKLPVSKSMANRYQIISALAGKRMETDWVSHDVELLHKALASQEKTMNFEDAGTPLRFYIAYAALRGLDVTIDGGERLRVRPIAPLLKALEELGAEFEHPEKAGNLPLKIKKGVDKSLSHVKLNAGLSSQFLSALLLVAPYFEQGLVIETEGELSSAPYIRLTIDIMDKAGVTVLVQDHKLSVKHASYNLKQDLNIESDWSAATFIYALAAMADEADIVLPGLRVDSAQGDAATVEILRQFGIISTRAGNEVHITKSGGSNDFIAIDFTDVPDMFPAIAALCAAKKTRAKFTGVKNLAFKESDRLEAMRANLVQTGTILSVAGNEATLEFSGKESGKYYFRSFNDHRIAMACSIFAFQKDITIDDETVVKKSFSDYWEVFRKLTA
jgi:3-phosphoshikimate 1-carboxyvinyltransferase